MGAGEVQTEAKEDKELVFFSSYFWITDNVIQFISIDKRRKTKDKRREIFFRYEERKKSEIHCFYMCRSHDSFPCLLMLWHAYSRAD